MQTALILILGRQISETHSTSVAKHVQPDLKHANEFLVFSVFYCLVCE